MDKEQLIQILSEEFIEKHNEIEKNIILKNNVILYSYYDYLYVMGHGKNSNIKNLIKYKVNQISGRLFI